MLKKQLTDSLSLRNPSSVLDFPVQIYGKTEKVSYGSGEDAYNGFIHNAVVLDGSEFPQTSDLHNTSELANGHYYVVIEIKGKGKIKPLLHYVPMSADEKKVFLEKKVLEFKA